MNKLPYLLTGGVAGGILGYLIADYVAYKIDESQPYEPFTKEEMDEMTGGMDKELYEAIEEGDNKKVDYAGARSSQAAATREEQQGWIALAHGLQEQGMTYTEIADRMEIPESSVRFLLSSVQQEMEETLEELTRPYQEEHAPYIMTAEEWEDPNTVFERVTVLFYEEDSVFCTEAEELIDDPANMFVPNAHLHFGSESGDPDVVYISNPGRSEMYEILRMHSSYQIEVLGEVPVESPKAKATSKKPASQSGSQKDRDKKEAEKLGDVDDNDGD